MHIKNPIKSILGKLFFGGIYYSLKPLKLFRTKTVYLIAPTEPGSYGDSAMIVSTIHKLQSKNLNVVVIGATNAWTSELAEYNLFIKTRAVRGLYSRFKSWPLLAFFFILDRPQSIYLFGADVMDGFYSVERSLARMAVLHLATSFSTDVRLLGFSFNDSPSETCRNYLKEISESGVKLFARDSVSSQRLSANGINNTNVADIAFMLEPQRDFHFDIYANYVCVNLNAIQYQKFGDSFINKVVEYLNHLQSDGLNLVFLPHDDRLYDGLSDFSLMEKVFNRLALKDKAYLFKEKLNAQKIRALASKAQFCIVGRKHMGVGALGEGIPTIFFGYQGKQEGLLKSFNIEPFLALLEPSSNVQEWLVTTNEFINSLDIIKAKIKEALPKVISLSEKNFSS